MTAAGRGDDEVRRVLDFPGERTLGAILSSFRRGAGDPTTRTSDRWAGEWWVAWPTPDGPVTVHRFGTRTSWWSWHPDQAALLVLVPVTLAGGWLLLRRRRG